MTLSRKRWDRVLALFEEAVDVPPGVRAGWLADACEGDDEIRSAVEALLEADEEDVSILDASLPELVEGVFEATPPAVESEERGEAGPVPRRVGPFRLIRLIGRGGMGTVWLAERSDEHFRRRVALKLLSQGLDPEEGEMRFRRERQVLASLEHPGIARLYDGGVAEDGRPYLAMEFVEGRRIDRWADERRLGVTERLRSFLQVCEAVQYAHRNLVVHRDLKPSNILVSDEGRVKLLDFGIAKVLGEVGGGPASPPTRTGVRVMTPEYASPEQLEGEPVTTVSDVYGLGLVLYELLTGRRPFPPPAGGGKDRLTSTVRPSPERPSTAVTRPGDGEGSGDRPSEDESIAVARARRSTPARLARRLRGDLDNILMKALREEPARRYPSVEALRQDLERHLEGRPVEARRASAPYRVRKFVLRHRVGVMAATLVVLSLSLGLVATMWQAREAARERDVAREVTAFLEELFEAPDPTASEGERLDTLDVGAFLDRGAERIRQELGDRPVVQARLMNVLGGVYRNLGVHDRARIVLEEALAVARGELGPTHPAVAEALTEMGETLRREGEYERAEALVREGLAMRRERFGSDHPDVAESLTYLGNVLLDRLVLDEAESAYREALEIRRAVSIGPDADPEVAGALANLAAFHVRAGEPAEAEPLLREALDILLSSYGEAHPTTANAMNSLAVVLLELRDYEAAEPLARRALELRRDVLGEDHPRVATTLNTLAQALWYQETPEKVAEAERRFLESLELRRRVHGEDHPDVGVAQNNLASFYATQERYADAIRTQRNALALMRDALGPEHAAVGIFTANLANHLREAGGGPEALPIYREATGILGNALPPGHPSLANARYGRGLSLLELERFEESEEELLAALAAFTEAAHPREPDVLADLVDLYEAWGRPAEADMYRRRLEDHAQLQGGPGGR